MTCVSLPDRDDLDVCRLFGEEALTLDNRFQRNGRTGLTGYCPHHGIFATLQARSGVATANITKQHQETQETTWQNPNKLPVKEPSRVF